MIQRNIVRVNSSCMYQPLCKLFTFYVYNNCGLIRKAAIGFLKMKNDNIIVTSN